MNPEGPDNGTFRVLRGGSFYFLTNALRASSRYGDYPVDRYDYIGFRCAQ